MRMVYICSPYAGDTEHNIEVTRRFCRYAFDNYYIPVAPHLMFPQFLDDNVPEEREMGITMGLELERKCDEVWVLADRISSGMVTEMRDAFNANYIKTIRFFKTNDAGLFEEMK